MITPYCSEPEVYDEARENIVLRAEVGSTVYGTGLPGHEDHDEIAVYVMPPTHVLGLNPVDSVVWRTAGADARSQPHDTDLAMYSLQKYVRLAAAGNPSILVPLYTPLDKVFELTGVGAELRGVRSLFTTKHAGYRFLGYMRAQRERMEASRAGTRAPRSNRPELIEKYGFDTKFAMHMLRLGYHGLELIKTGELEFPIPDPVGEVLRRVRRGEISYDDILIEAEILAQTLEHEIETSDLPDHPDPVVTEKLIWDLHRLHWTVKGLL